MTVVKGGVTKRAPKVHLVETGHCGHCGHCGQSKQRRAFRDRDSLTHTEWTVDKRRFPTFSLRRFQPHSLSESATSLQQISSLPFLFYIWLYKGCFQDPGIVKEGEGEQYAPWNFFLCWYHIDLTKFQIWKRSQPICLSPIWSIILCKWTIFRYVGEQGRYSWAE